MKRTFILVGIALLAFAIFLLQQYALDMYLYWRFWWFDVLMHGLGGVLIGSFALWFFVFEFQTKYNRLLLFSLASVLGVGIAWEIFEKVAGWQVDRTLAAYVFDTLGDIVMDILGGFLAYFICSRIWKNSLSQ
ncbi:hypothetical protein A2841_00470 [Candidatus Kaiserbacteria bacterium RIFCSPHIGHO2_01_FULL_48_10]|uniref:VanZ-like domain-containing protein n=1 Tax=Candidatus Kaiserbacteria bacterium RIFCSPHIGHO2_01_FULL_48_10 TaxID=1798476 RepID=A0A1F6C5Q5_9BACT|nr:MAG: hypothetical protein A2841_00470 [Candidatus Kaiserbacteria bacterium RIFCSPHIGHO2_01_FULL_48_10]